VRTGQPRAGTQSTGILKRWYGVGGLGALAEIAGTTKPTFSDDAL
jgi:hypothetical protein